MKYSPENGAAPALGSRGLSERRFALKRATDAAHARVEAIVQSADMFGNLDGYRRYVSATWAVRERFERLLDTNGAADLWAAWPGRRIARLAALDLADLGGSKPVALESHHLVLTRGELLGVLYVLEGSCLGARILVKLVGALGLSHTFGARHLHAQAGETGAWRSFLDVLDASAEPPCQETARLVFADFADAYQQACA
jgi:heme oxygenase